MKKSDWKRVRALFELALEMPEADRLVFVESECIGSPELEEEVLAMLRFSKESPSILDRPIPRISPHVLSIDDDQISLGDKYGSYVALEKIGSGGMGEVFLGRRNDSLVEQKVAIKLLRSDRMGGKSVRARFDQERRILARLDHSRIARFLDGGISGRGVPFLIMEYVSGKPLIDHCNEKGLGLEARLRLFQQICDAVQFAHQSLVVHRDLKPSNILVEDSSLSAQGGVKLLDFGIAKLLESEDDEPGLTLTGVKPMTPDYASPEQVRGQNITTVSDIYSLGVILFELLCGRKPYTLKDVSASEVDKIVCVNEPDKPSSKLEMSFATTNGYDAKSLAGDLDNIILKALSKEAPRRYESAAQFGADIESYLQHRPVLARRDSFRYKSSKFVIRNKLPVALGALIVLALMVGLYTTSRQAKIAEERFQQIHSLANSLVTEINDSLDDLPRVGEARQQILDRALKILDQLSKEETKDPLLLSDLALAYEKTSQLETDKTAEEILTKAVEIRKALRVSAPENKSYQLHMGRAYGKLAMMKSWGGATEESIEYALNALDELKPLESNWSQSELAKYHIAKVQSELAWFYIYDGKLEKGNHLVDESIELFESLAKEVYPSENARLDLWRAYYYKIDGLRFTSRFDEMHDLLQTKALPFVESMHERNSMSPRIQNILHVTSWFLGNSYLRREEFDLARNYFESSLEINDKIVEIDPDNLRGYEGLAHTHSSLASLHSLQGASELAIESHRKAVEIRQSLWDRDKTSIYYQSLLGESKLGQCEEELNLGKMDKFSGSCGEAKSILKDHFEKAGGGMVTKGGLITAYYQNARYHRLLAARELSDEIKRSNLLEARRLYVEADSIMQGMKSIWDEVEWRTSPKELAEAMTRLNQEMERL